MFTSIACECMDSKFYLYLYAKIKRYKRTLEKEKILYF